ncbi:hypothetical protein DIPPA_28454 [Diplonema papillatum]|nr:hypothetical protein DIPPA_28454 [Diplonema papillatum]
MTPESPLWPGRRSFCEAAEAPGSIAFVALASVADEFSAKDDRCVRPAAWLACAAAVGFWSKATEDYRRGRALDLLQQLFRPIAHRKAFAFRQSKNERAMPLPQAAHRKPTVDSLKASSPILDDWSHADLSLLRDNLCPLPLAVNAVVTYEGSPAKAAFFVGFGSIALSRRRVVAHIEAERPIPAGRWVGIEEMAIGEKLLNTGIVRENSMLWFVKESSFLRMQGAKAKFGASPPSEGSRGEAAGPNQGVRAKAAGCLSLALSEKALSVDVLRSQFGSFFELWSDHALATLLAATVPRVYLAGDAVQKQGGVPAFQLLVSGAVIKRVTRPLFMPNNFNRLGTTAIADPTEVEQLDAEPGYQICTGSFVQELQQLEECQAPMIVGMECCASGQARTTVTATACVEAWSVDRAPFMNALLCDPSVALASTVELNRHLAPSAVPRLPSSFVSAAFRRHLPHGHRPRWPSAPPGLDQFLKAGQPLFLVPGSVLLEPTDTCEGVYFQVAGTAELIKTDAPGVRYEYSAGTCFGLEFAVFLKSEWGFRVRSVSDTAWWFVGWDDVRDFLDKQSPATADTIRASARELFLQTSEALVAVARSTSDASISMPTSPGTVQLTPTMDRMLRSWAESARKKCLVDPLPVSMQEAVAYRSRSITEWRHRSTCGMRGGGPALRRRRPSAFERGTPPGLAIGPRFSFPAHGRTASHPRTPHAGTPLSTPDGAPSEKDPAPSQDRGAIRFDFAADPIENHRNNKKNRKQASFAPARAAQPPKGGTGVFTSRKAAEIASVQRVLGEARRLLSAAADLPPADGSQGAAVEAAVAASAPPPPSFFPPLEGPAPGARVALTRVPDGKPGFTPSLPPLPASLLRPGDAAGPRGNPRAARTSARVHVCRAHAPFPRTEQQQQQTQQQQQQQPRPKALRMSGRHKAYFTHKLGAAAAAAVPVAQPLSSTHPLPYYPSSRMLCRSEVASWVPPPGARVALTRVPDGKPGFTPSLPPLPASLLRPGDAAGPRGNPRARTSARVHVCRAHAPFPRAEQQQQQTQQQQQQQQQPRPKALRMSGRHKAYFTHKLGAAAAAAVPVAQPLSSTHPLPYYPSSRMLCRSEVASLARSGR